MGARLFSGNGEMHLEKKIRRKKYFGKVNMIKVAFSLFGALLLSN
jgi:hypothetical protein